MALQAPRTNGHGRYHSITELRVRGVSNLEFLGHCGVPSQTLLTFRSRASVPVVLVVRPFNPCPPLPKFFSSRFLETWVKESKRNLVRGHPSSTSLVLTPRRNSAAGSRCRQGRTIPTPIPRSRRAGWKLTADLKRYAPSIATKNSRSEKQPHNVKHASLGFRKSLVHNLMTRPMLNKLFIDCRTDALDHGKSKPSISIWI